MRSALRSAPLSITVRVVSRRRSEAQRPRAERTPLARGQRIVSIPSSAAIAAACIGPAPPNGSRAKPRGAIPRSTVTTRSALTISWLATRTTPAAASSGSGPSQLAPEPTARPAGATARGAPRRRRRGGAAPGGLHHQGRRQPRLFGRLGEPPEVTAEQWAQVGVDRRRRAALVLAETRQHLMRGGDVDTGQARAQVLGEAPLVGGVEVGEEEADRDRLGAPLAQQLGQPLRLVLAERRDDSIGADPLVRLEAEGRLDPRRRLRLAQAVQLGPLPAARLQPVRSTPRRR